MRFLLYRVLHDGKRQGIYDAMQHKRFYALYLPCQVKFVAMHKGNISVKKLPTISFY